MTKSTEAAKAGRQVFIIAVTWLESRGWERARNKSMLWRRPDRDGKWMSFGDAFMLQMRYDGVHLGNTD